MSVGGKKLREIYEAADGHRRRYLVKILSLLSFADTGDAISSKIQ